ncbi:MAG TPA: hypothetical protein VGJ60_20205 [Chloroflexota bacterium]|jgi:hypothetical protein
MLAEDQVERDEWLCALIERSPVLADAALRRHWSELVPWLPPAARYELAGILLEFEQACET